MGEIEGSDVGFIVVDIGLWVGLSVGLNVGETVGSRVGSLSGSCVGFKVSRSRVGDVEGSFDGRAVVGAGEVYATRGTQQEKLPW